MKKLENVTGIINTMGGEIQKLKGESTPVIYNYIDDNMPEWAKPTVKKLADAGALKGGDTGLALDDVMLRLLVINDRMGLYDK